MTELADGAQRAAEALAPEDGDGAVSLAALAERSLAPLERLAPELARAGEELRDVELRLREARLRPSRLPRLAGRGPTGSSTSKPSWSGSPTRAAASARPYADLLARAAAARDEARGAQGRTDPVAAAAEALAAAEERSAEIAARLRATREAAATAFATAVAEELQGVGMGEGEFPRRAARARRRADRRGRGGLPDPPECRAAVRSRRRDGLRREALSASRSRSRPWEAARRSSSTRSTPASAVLNRASVAATLKRLAERTQVLTITHLPQIRERRRRALPGREDPGRSDHTRIERLDELQRRDELERMLGSEFISTLR